jgi:hypothetical protein
MSAMGHPQTNSPGVNYGGFCGRSGRRANNPYEKWVLHQGVEPSGLGAGIWRVSFSTLLEAVHLT